MKESDRDFLAVQEDALLLDIVAARGDLSAFADEHIAQLLGSYTEDIDVGIEQLTNAELPAVDAPVVALPVSARRSTKFLIATTTAVVLVGTSGVAAAVTGDPLSPFREVVKVVTGHDDSSTGQAEGGKDGELPDSAADEAELTRQLNEVNQAIRDGDWEKAAQLLDQVKGDVGGAPDIPPGLQDRIDKMDDKVAQAGNEPKDPADGNKGGQGKNSDKGQNGEDKNTTNPNQPGQGDDEPGKPDKTEKTEKTDRDVDNQADPPDNQGGRSGEDHSSQPHPTTGPRDTGHTSGDGGQSKGRPDKSAGSKGAASSESGSSQ